MYFEALKEAMDWLGRQPKVLFLGQAVGCTGTAMSNTLKDVPADLKLELPVFEEVQMGMSLGLSLQGFVPVSVFPRWNFLLCAVSQLVNHIDKYSMMSDYQPKVIIRTGIGSVNPLDPQWQHKGDFTQAMQMMLRTVRVVKLERPEQVLPAYKDAYYQHGSTILCEVSDFYDEEFRKTYEKFSLTYS
jgi:pyruvate/2-oxoglutarate/acetoin dehydrogenase E1 component